MKKIAERWADLSDISKAVTLSWAFPSMEMGDCVALRDLIEAIRQEDRKCLTPLPKATTSPPTS